MYLSKISQFIDENDEEFDSSWRCDFELTGEEIAETSESVLTLKFAAQCTQADKMSNEKNNKISSSSSSSSASIIFNEIQLKQLSFSDDDSVRSAHHDTQQKQSCQSNSKFLITVLNNSLITRKKKKKIMQTDVLDSNFKINIRILELHASVSRKSVNNLKRRNKSHL